MLCIASFSFSIALLSASIPSRALFASSAACHHSTAQQHRTESALPRLAFWGEKKGERIPSSKNKTVQISLRNLPKPSEIFSETHTTQQII
eukprot:2057119-Rhodomonas_salina.1